MVFFLFFTRCGEYTQEEFKIAYEQFKISEKHKPIIYVYFKNLSEGVSAEDSVKEFAKEIDKEWKEGNEKFNEFYYKEVISLCIIFKETERLVSNQDGFCAN